MKLAVLLQYEVLVATVHAASFKLPVVSNSPSSEPLPWHIEKSLFPQCEKLAERPLRYEPIGDTENDGDHMYQIAQPTTMRENFGFSYSGFPRNLLSWDWNELIYTVPINIGTPPQPLNTLLSISEPDLLIPSFTSGRDRAGLNFFSYTNSSTNIHRHEVFITNTQRGRASGFLSEDKLSFSNLEIHQKFGEFTKMEEELPHPNDRAWDGVFGLGPSRSIYSWKARLPPDVLNPFHNMITQNLLDKNLFSLKLPRGAEKEGEILFGAIDHDSYVGELKSFPLLQDGSYYNMEVRERWAINVTTVKLGLEGADDLDMDLNSTVAVFETGSPYIFLPEKYVRLLEKKLGFDNAGESWDWDGIRSIDCRLRTMLNDIKITLGEEDFVLTPWDYTLEVSAQTSRGRETICLSAFMPQFKCCPSPNGRIVLGSAFLKAFYGVFDLEQQTISLAPRRPSRMEDGESWVQNELK